MDVYTQLEDKLVDMTRRLTQEAKYFHECEASDPRTIGEGGMEAGKASKPRFPLLNFPDTFPHGHPRAGQPHPLARQPVPYPHPEHETKGSLAMRAQLSAAALIALNEQVDAVLATLPEDEGKAQNQAEILEQLAQDNELAGEALRDEAAQAEDMIAQMREALMVLQDGRSRDSLHQHALKLELAARGLRL